MAGSWWSDFLDNITPDSAATLAKPFAGGMGKLASVADAVVPDEYQTEKVYTTGAGVTERVTKRPNVLGQVAKPIAAMTMGPVEAASTVLMKAETYGYGRPTSVVAQATNRFNPLYEDGLQLSDFQKMWEKSRNDSWEGTPGDSPGISPGQAAWWGVLSGVKAVEQAGSFGQAANAFAGTLAPFAPGGLGVGLMAQGVAGVATNPGFNADQIGAVKRDLNIYDPVQQKQLYDNSLFAVATGVTDTAYQLFGVGKGGDTLARATRRGVGLETTIDSVRDVHKAGGKIMSHIRWVETAGAEGKPNIYGKYVMDVAETRDVATIVESPLFKGSPKAIEIASMLENVDDPITVAKVWAADKGDGMAIAALMRDDPDFAWRMADMPLKLQLQAAMDEIPLITRDNAEMYGTIYDRALDRPGREFYKTAKDIFLAVDEDTTSPAFGMYNATTFNSRSKPITGLFGEAARSVADSRRRASMGEGWNSTFLGKIGGSEPATVMVQWMGGRRPQGHVNLSGLVPTDAVDEVLSTVGRIKWTRGSRTWEFMRDGELVPMTGPQWRSEATARLAYAQRNGETAVWNELVSIEKELISTVVTRMGLSADDAAKLADQVVDKKNASMSAASETGFFFDASGNRVLIHAQTQRQLADSYVMFPIEEFAREARMMARGQAGKGSKLLSTRHVGDQVYEAIQKYVRTEQLIRPSYMKNSIVEPIGSRLIAEGVSEIIPLTADFAVGTGRWFVNRARQTGAAAYWVGDKLHVTGQGRINREAFAIHNERMKIQDQLDTMVALQHDAASGKLSPGQTAVVRPIVDEEVADLTRRLRSLQEKADIADPGWRSTPGATPSFRDVRQAVLNLHSVVREPAKLDRLRQQLAVTETAYEQSRARTLAAQRAAVTSAEKRVREIEAQLASATDPTSAVARDVQRDMARKYRSLKFMEQRLAGAQRQVDGMAGPDGQLALSPVDQNIVDTFPKLIDDLKSELGDWAPPPAKSAELVSSEEWLAELRQALDDEVVGSQRELSQLRAAVPKMQRNELGELTYVPDKAEMKGITARAEAQLAEEIDAAQIGVDGGMRRLPYDYERYVASLTPIERSVFEKEGLIPVDWAVKFLTGGDTLDDLPFRAETFWTWLDDGTDDFAAAQRRGVELHAGEAELRAMAVSRKRATDKTKRTPLTEQEWDDLKNNRITDMEVLKKLGRSKRIRTGEQDAALKALGIKTYTPNGAQEGAKWIPLRWYRIQSKDGKQTRLDALIGDELDGLSTAKEADYDDYLRAIAEREAEADAVLTEFRQAVGIAEQTVADLKSQAAGVADPNLKGVFDPVPGPFNVEYLRREKKRLEEVIRVSQEGVGIERGTAARVKALKEQVAQAERVLADPDLIAEIEDLRLALDVAADARLARPVKTPINPASQIRQLEERLAKVNARLDANKGKQNRALARREATRKRSRTGESDVTVTVGTETVTSKGLFAPDNFGEAKRNEFSSAYTNRATFDPGQTSLANSRVMSMAHGSETILPTSPRYGDELAYVANRHVTGDPLTTLLLQGADNSRVLAWMSRPGGQAYLARMGWQRNELIERIVDTVADQTKPGARVAVWDDGKINTLRSVLFQYFPTEESRHVVLRGESTASELMASIADVPAEMLSPIQGRSIELAKTGQANLNPVMRVIDKLWDNFASKPENVISRWPFAQKMYKRELQARLQIMAEQGIKVSSREVNALNRAITTDVLRESKRTFYNITRYSNPVYAARYVLVYPQAVFNTLWRAARLAYRNPGSAMVMNNAWTQFFTANGVDENGEYTNDYGKVETLVFTVPQALQNLGVGPQAKLPAKAWQLLSDRQGATWTVQIPAQTFLMHQPTQDQLLREALGPAYEMVFPFGTPSGLNDYSMFGVPVGAVIPNYAKSIFAATMVDKDKFMRVQTQIHEHELAVYYKALENGEQATKPTVPASSAKARWYWLATAVAQAGIPGGGGLQPEGQVELDTIRRIQEKYNYDREAALPEILQALPHIDPRPLMQSTSEYRAYIPSTVEALSIIKDPEVEDLLRRVTKDGNGDPEMVELLVADKVGDFNANVYDTLGTLVIPGDNAAIRVKTDPTVVEGRMEAEKSWDKYNANKNAIMAEVTRRGLKSMPAALQNVWNAWVDDFKSKPENKAWVAQYGKRDASAALRAVDTLTGALSDPGMEKHRDTAYWRAAKKYLVNLAPMVEAFRNPDLTTDQKDGLKLVWDSWVNTNLGSMDPQFLRMYNKHLAGYDVEI